MNDFASFVIQSNLLIKPTAYWLIKSASTEVICPSRLTLATIFCVSVKDIKPFIYWDTSDAS